MENKLSTSIIEADIIIIADEQNINMTESNTNIVEPPMDITVRNANMVEPNEDIVEPNVNMVEPNEDIVEPNEDIVEPNENMVEPNENIIEPNENIIELNENIIEPNENTIEPKKMLYINCLNSRTIDLKAIKLDFFMKEHLIKYFDMVCIYDIETIDLLKYDLVLINALTFSYNSSRIKEKEAFAKLNLLGTIKNVGFLMHDLHDYSLRFENKKAVLQRKKIDYQKPVLRETKAKILHCNIFKASNAKFLISIYDCPEYDYFVKYFTNINNFYTINHGYPKDIFKPMNTPKCYDILFYGRFLPGVYPFRCQLSDICSKSKFRFRFVNACEKIKEESLCELINKSWLCIACVSNFSYFVRKYLEISACNSLVLGDINEQGYSIIGSNMVYVNNKMDSKKILEKIEYYLSNKEIISALSYNKLQKIENENYEFFAKKLYNICTNFQENTESGYMYKNYAKYININKNKHNKKLIDNITFENIDGNTYSTTQLENGLYVFISKSNFSIYDAADNIITRSDTHFVDSTEPDIIYVPFRLDSKTKIKLVGDFDLLNLQLYIINI